MGQWRVRKSVPLVAGLPAVTSMRRSAVLDNEKTNTEPFFSSFEQGRAF